MQLNRLFTYTIILLVLASCGRRESSYNAEGSCIDKNTAACITNKKNSPIVGRGTVLLPTTPIKDQGSTELCWIYAMLATIETDRLALGDSVNLSPLWFERKSIEEQADNTFLTGGNISLRGTLPEAMRLMQTYGTIAWDAYHLNTPLSSRVITRKTKQLAKTCAGQQRDLNYFRNKLTDILDSEFGPAPRFVFMLGAEYTPLEFTHSLCLPGEWKAYTSFTHHPFNESFAVEVPDNRQHHEAYNIPIDSLLYKVRKSLRQRHPVAWEGCMKNNAENIKFHNLSIQNTRQQLFERHILTDDHCMAIVGMAHAKNGETYFICKNSWGINDGNHGYRYMTERQFALSTIMIMSKE